MDWFTKGQVDFLASYLFNLSKLLYLIAVKFFYPAKCGKIRPKSFLGKIASSSKNIQVKKVRNDYLSIYSSLGGENVSMHSESSSASME